MRTSLKEAKETVAQILTELPERKVAAEPIKAAPVEEVKEPKKVAKPDKGKEESGGKTGKK